MVTPIHVVVGIESLEGDQDIYDCQLQELSKINVFLTTMFYNITHHLELLLISKVLMH